MGPPFATTGIMVPVDTIINEFGIVETAALVFRPASGSDEARIVRVVKDAVSGTYSDKIVLTATDVS